MKTTNTKLSINYCEEAILFTKDNSHQATKKHITY